jgi:hypothetical protein
MSVVYPNECNDCSGRSENPDSDRLNKSYENSEAEMHI